eukprot:m.173105 g.173105  ORF g.173105 m.173105 type:complete len:319 (+) comp39090_c0_seq1:2571-3527(+)
MCQSFGIRRSSSTPYHPQANGAVERINRFLGDAIAKLMNENQRNWPDLLYAVQFAHNSAIHEFIGETPYRIIFKESPRTLVDAAADALLPTAKPTLPPREYVQNAESYTPQLYKDTREKARQSAVRRREQYNKKTRFHRYEVGDLVWAARATVKRGQCRSLAPRWTGPYVVTGKSSNVIYAVKRLLGRKVFRLHHDALKPYLKRSPKLSIREQRPEAVTRRQEHVAWTTESEEGEYGRLGEPEAVLGGNRNEEEGFSEGTDGSDEGSSDEDERGGEHNEIEHRLVLRQRREHRRPEWTRDYVMDLSGSEFGIDRNITL